MKKVLCRIISCLLVFSLMLSLIACGGGNPKKLKISVGNWPTPESSNYQYFQDLEKNFEAKYPDIDIVPDEYRYDVNSFVAKAAGNQLPTLYVTHFTEIDKIVNNGFARDITEAAKSLGYIDNMNSSVYEILSRDDKLYGIPNAAYAMGLFANKKLFEDSDLLNEDGTVKFPSTYEELALTAQTIKEKTGKSGFMLSTTNNCGGWHFMNIAWSFGVKFMEQKKDGNWISTFDTPECVAALQYVKDLRWKYDVLPSNVFVDGTEINKLFASGETAMIFLGPPAVSLTTNYGMNKDYISVGRLPSGSDGRYSQFGGSVYMVEPNATDEQVDAVMKWLSFIGATSDFSDEQVESWENDAKSTVESGGYVWPTIPLPLWINEDRTKAYENAVGNYVNIDERDISQYLSFKDVIVKPEEPQCAQQLYAVLDSCIQEVLTNKDADVQKLITTANDEFQKNYLDKLENN